MSASLSTLGGFDISRVHSDWLPLLSSLEPQLADIHSRISRQYDDAAHLPQAAASEVTAPYLPAADRVFAALATSPSDVRAIILGQDPYPTPGHAIGLAFATDRHVKPLPRSLNNIYQELRDDLGIEPAEHGDLSAWADQGVLLLNRVLTVAPGAAASHHGMGWEQVSSAIVTEIVALKNPLVGILWGKPAQTLAPLFGDVPLIESAHPSPLSARRGFFGSKPFSRTNEMLIAQGASPIDWQLPDLAENDRAEGMLF
ncbi:uracil-DNA glycosylase [Neomicrococcus lactis]|uniref:Uracil-DNA glycosylase n=1 Tax=Neomicrococcus lactis TaxID=732241 RepID=A0A7W8YBD7_9MICC|nr:uracil-DNA glycosylase [Neomicrococcus lactis]MBB5598425.1 uracil-DNA glycosylase [Neomicrococcus lactis]